MDNLYGRICNLCEAHDVPFTRMCVDLGLSKGLKNKLQNDPERTITLDTAIKIATYFNVSVDTVAGLNEKEKPSANGGEPFIELSDEERQLIQISRERPGMATALLAVARQIETAASAQG